MKARVREWLERQPAALLAAWAMVAAFTAYGCMYAFRKPFSAGTFAGSFWGLDYKVLLVLAQLSGYTVSKFLGIKFISEAPPQRRALMVLILIGIAEVALALFAVTPAPWNAALLFLNGLPLGMVWGLIFAALEGRRITEFMTLGLSFSQVFSSGWVKAVGLHLMHVWGVNEFWMPAATGALFLPLLVVSLAMLAVLPPPNAADVAARTLRVPMDRQARHVFLRKYWLGTALMVTAYMGLMTYRDVRDTFQVNILRELGLEVSGGQIAGIETTVGVVVIAAVGFFARIRSNRLAFNLCCALIGLGGVITGVATALLQAGTLGPMAWMTVTGIGLYAAFVPFQAILFERLLANLHLVGTAAFLVAICDSYGYLSTVALYLEQVFGGHHVSWVGVLSTGGYVLALGVPLLMFAAWAVFVRRHAAPHPTLLPEPV